VDLRTLGGTGFGYRFQDLPVRPDMIAA